MTAQSPARTCLGGADNSRQGNNAEINSNIKTPNTGIRGYIVFKIQSNVQNKCQEMAGRLIRGLGWEIEIRLSGLFLAKEILEDVALCQDLCLETAGFAEGLVTESC